MVLVDVLNRLNAKHRGNVNFSFRISHETLEVQYTPDPVNIIKIDENGRVDCSRWFSGSNSNGPWLSPAIANKPSLETIEHIVDRLITIPGSVVTKWRFKN